ncbi:hypothetical protein GCM10027053_11660 [Intrasporangium mesophilum]
MWWCAGSGAEVVQAGRAERRPHAERGMAEQGTAEQGTAAASPGRAEADVAGPRRHRVAAGNDDGQLTGRSGDRSVRWRGRGRRTAAYLVVSGATEGAGDALQVDVAPTGQAEVHEPSSWTEALVSLALAATGWWPPGRHPEHPTAREGCCPASRGLALDLVTCRRQ